MLVLSRKPQETIVIDSTMLKPGQPIFIRVLEVKNAGKTVCLGIEAEAHITIHREEIYQRIQAEKSENKTKKI